MNEYDPYGDLGYEKTYTLDEVQRTWQEKQAEKDRLLADTYTFASETGICPDLQPQPHVEMCMALDEMEPDWDDREQESMLYMYPRHTYKDLAITTFVPTPLGMKEMGSLQVGDLVYDMDGKTTSIIGVSPIYYNRKCYAVTFNTGEVIVAGGEHNWITSTRYDRDKCKGKEHLSVKTTEQIAQTLMCRDEYNHRVPLASPTENYTLFLLVPPYTLGAWLGDGTSSNGSITCSDEEILDYLRREGTPVTWAPNKTDSYHYVLNGGAEHSTWRKKKDSVAGRLRALGVLNNKHIPEQYLFASLSQRLALLQGLMDTDGSISKRDRSCSFSNTNFRLLRQVRQLVASLGFRPSKISYYNPPLNGKTFGTFRFSASTENLCPFRLTRKRNLIGAKPKAARKGRSIVSVEEVSSVPTKCIMVDSTSATYLVGSGYIPTHNTSLVEASICRLILKYPNIAIGLFRASRELAAQMVENISSHLKYNPIILELWGDVSEGSEKWSEYELRVNTRTKNRREPTLFSAGLKVTTTGLHFDAIFDDDLVTEQNCDSTKEMEQAKKLLQAQKPLMSPWGKRVISGTIWSNIDAYVWALGKNDEALRSDPPKKPPYLVRMQKAYHTNPTTGELELFFPAVLTEAFLEQQRNELEPRWYAAWYLLETHEIGMKPFPVLNFFSGDYQTYPTPHVILTDAAYSGEIVHVYPVLLVDPALTASAASDSFGMIALGFDANENWLVLESREVRKLPAQAGDEIIELLMEYEPKIAIIESANADAEMLSRIGQVIADMNLNCQVIGYSALQDEAKGKRGKAQRIGALQPINNQGKLLLRRRYNSVLSRQLDLYPSLVHDDVLDALAMGRKAFALSVKPTALPPGDDGREKTDAWKQQLVQKLQRESESDILGAKGDWTGVSSQIYGPVPPPSTVFQTTYGTGVKLVSTGRNK